MAIDPNIILQAQPVQSPLDSYTKIMALKDMAQQRDMRAQDSQMRGLQLQQAQREAGETQALKDAYAKNTTIGQNGMPVVNRQGILSDLTQNGYGQLASQHAMNFQDMDLKAVQRNHELAKTLVAGMQDQNSYSANVQKGIAYGVPGFDKLPAQYDPTIVERASRGLGSLEEQLKQKNTERELAAKELEAKSKAAEAGIPYGGAGGSRGAPAGPTGAAPRASGQLLDQDPADLLSRVPMKDREKVAAQIDAAKNATANGPKILQSFDSAYGSHPGVVDYTPGFLNADQKAFHAMMGPTFKDVEGTVRQAAMDNMFSNTTPQFGDRDNTPSIKRNAVINYLTDKSAASLAKNYGIDLSKYKATNAKAALDAVGKKDGPPPGGSQNYEHMTDAEVKAAYDKLVKGGK